MPQFKRLEEMPHTLICDDGYALNTDTGHVYKNHLKHSGYYEVNIDGRYFLIHRLVAKAFCNGYIDGMEVNHKDGNKANNCASNLEWVAHNDNLKHAYETGLRKTDVSNREVICIDMFTGKKRAFPSIYRAAKELGISKGNICLCCKGIRPHASGFYWEYSER